MLDKICGFQTYCDKDFALKTVFFVALHVRKTEVMVEIMEIVIAGAATVVDICRYSPFFVYINVANSYLLLLFFGVDLS